MLYVFPGKEIAKKDEQVESTRKIYFKVKNIKTVLSVITLKFLFI
jgi:hypothetical protein